MSTSTLDDVRILLVDDEPEMLDLLDQFLRDCGARVTVVHSARAALAAIVAEAPDVLISDIGMPGEDGYWLIRAVRALPRGGGGAVPAIAMTGDVVTNSLGAIFHAGFDELRAKPFELADLADLVARLAVADTRCGT